MTFTRIALALIILAALAATASTCDPRPSAAPPQQADRKARMRAADDFTRRYAHSRMACWNVHAAAAGARCGVLLIQVAVVMEDSMVDAMHYGTGPYDVLEGGVDRFYRSRTFRGVTYRDATGRVWPYGAVLRTETHELAPCR